MAELTKSQPPEFEAYVERLRPDYPDLATDFTGFTGIEQVLHWMSRRGLSGKEVDILGQDEFHYDFLLRLDAAGRWLSFGVN